MSEELLQAVESTKAPLTFLGAAIHKLNAKWWRKSDGSPLDITSEHIAMKIALMHSELSEALEGLRKDKMDDHLPSRLSIEVEFADCIIRILDTGAALGLDIPGAIVEKCAYNATRHDHTLEARSAEGGKKF